MCRKRLDLHRSRCKPETNSSSLSLSFSAATPSSHYHYLPPTEKTHLPHLSTVKNAATTTARLHPEPSSRILKTSRKRCCTSNPSNFEAASLSRLLTCSVLVSQGRVDRGLSFWTKKETKNDKYKGFFILQRKGWCLEVLNYDSFSFCSLWFDKNHIFFL